MLKRAAKRIVLRSFFARVDAFLAIGEENKKFYRAYGIPEKKIFFVPYAVDNDHFFAAADHYAKDRDGLRRELGLPPQAFVVLFAGKLREKKNPMDILQAYAKIASDGTSCVFVGDGQLRRELEGYVAREKVPGVVFAGFKNQSEMPKWLATADLFVLYSGVGETWGLGINEAMCFSVPIVASSMVGCALDLVRDNGMIVPLGDSDVLAAAFRKFKDDAGLCRTAGARSREIVSAYSFDADRRGILAALSSLLK